MNLLVLVVDDEPDVEMLFRQQSRHDLRSGRFTMEFAQSGDAALQRINDAAGVSIILIVLAPRIRFGFLLLYSIAFFIFFQSNPL